MMEKEKSTMKARMLLIVLQIENGGAKASGKEAATEVFKDLDGKSIVRTNRL